MTVFLAESDDAEAFYRGATFTVTAPPDPGGLLLWGNFLSHELFHFWNGQRIKGEPRPDRQWSSEGVTEYYANLAVVRSGAIGTAGFLRKAEHHVGDYLQFRTSPVFAGVSLVEAGRDKGRFRQGVHSGGWCVALALDVRIRQATDHSRSLDDFMEQLYREFGLTREPYALGDLAQIASEVAGTDLAELFDACVIGTDTLPMKEVLRDAGLQSYLKPYAGEALVVFDEAARDAAVRIRAGLFTGD